jgi:hypothetical protein
MHVPEEPGSVIGYLHPDIACIDLRLTLKNLPDLLRHPLWCY